MVLTAPQNAFYLGLGYTQGQIDRGDIPAPSGSGLDIVFPADVFLAHTPQSEEETVQQGFEPGKDLMLDGYESFEVGRPVPQPVGEPTTFFEDFSTNGGQEESLLVVVAGSPGDDLRDGAGGGGVVQAGLPIVAIGAVAALARVALPASRAALGRLFGPLARGARVRWDSLPGWARTVLATAGIVAGTELVMDLPGVPGEGAFFGGGGEAAMFGPGGPGVSVIGTWTANGVNFYRLSDGRLAVQNKHGRWKVWRPKKPIVLMPTGAGNLRTLLRADAVLNRQSKRIATMLNRRGGQRPRRTPKSPQGVTVVAQDGSKVTQI